MQHVGQAMLDPSVVRESVEPPAKGIDRRVLSEQRGSGVHECLHVMSIVGKDQRLPSGEVPVQGAGACPRFAHGVVAFELLGEWVNQHTARPEHVIEVGVDDHRATLYHVMSMMPVDNEAQLLAGERLYGDEGFVRVLLGPYFDLLEPIAEQ
jgi:hypothetical protein